MELTEQSLKLLKDYYMKEGETDPSEAFKRAGNAFSGGDKQLAKRIYSYIDKGWFMFSSPILSNAPEINKTSKGLPISCFLGFVPDSLKGLIEHTSELRWLSVKGGGVGGHWSSVRSVSDVAPGPIPFLHTVDSDMTAYKQGVTRKGSYAAYMDISHPDILEFMSLRIPTGDVNRKCLNIHHGVNVPDSFMDAVKDDLVWELVDPKTGEQTDTLMARELWETLLETRYRTGEPYIYFIDTANNAYPQTQKDLGLFSRGSNLCVAGDTTLDVIVDGDPMFGVRIDEVIRLLNTGFGVKVMSYNIETGGYEFKSIEDGALMNKNISVIEIEDTESGNVIRCTEDHKIFTQNRGYVEARHLNENDILKIS